MHKKAGDVMTESQRSKWTFTWQPNKLQLHLHPVPWRNNPLKGKLFLKDMQFVNYITKWQLLTFPFWVGKKINKNSPRFLFIWNSFLRHPPGFWWQSQTAPLKRTTSHLEEARLPHYMFYYQPQSLARQLNSVSPRWWNFYLVLVKSPFVAHYNRQNHMKIKVCKRFSFKGIFISRWNATTALPLLGVPETWTSFFLFIVKNTPVFKIMTPVIILKIHSK